MEECDYLIVGTGLVQSLLACALAGLEKSVFVVDDHAAYGGADRTESLADLERDIKKVDGTLDSSSELPLGAKSRIALSLRPRMMRCVGPWVDLAATAGLGRYMDLKLLGTVQVAVPVENGDAVRLVPVPTSKEDVFSSNDLTLVEKRRVMRALGAEPDAGAAEATWAEALAAQQLTSPRLQLLVTYGAALAEAPMDELAASHVTERLAQFRASLGRFGRGAFLRCMHETGSELVQALCRVSAVHGAVFALRDRISGAGESKGDVRLASGVCLRVRKRVICVNDTLVHRQHYVSLVAFDAKEPCGPRLIVVPPSVAQAPTAVFALLEGSEMGATPTGLALLHVWCDTRVPVDLAAVAGRLREMDPDGLGAMAVHASWTFERGAAFSDNDLADLGERVFRVSSGDAGQLVLDDTQILAEAQRAFCELEPDAGPFAIRPLGGGAVDDG